MSSDSASRSRDVALLAADGAVITAGTFAAMIGLAFGLDALGVVPLGGPSGSGLQLVLSIFSWLLQVSGFVVGPVLVWWLHRRRFGKFEVIGGVVGFGLSGAVIFPVAALGGAIGWFVGLFTSVEFAGAIAYLVLIVVAFVVVMIWVDVRAIRDLARRADARTSLDIARLVATAAVVVFGAIVVAKMLAGEDAGEAFVFVLAAGVEGAVVVAIADVVARFLAKQAAKEVPGAV